MAVLCLCAVISNAQSVSNEGTEFYAAFPTHVNAPDYDQSGRLIRSNFAEYSIFITGKQASSGVVTVGGVSQPFNLPQGNTVVEIRVPRTQAYINESEQKTVLSNRAIRVVVDPGKPKVVVYGHIFAGRRSAASLILPKEALGQQYFTMNREVGLTGDGGQNHFVIVATDPDTRVMIQRNGTDLVPGGVLLRNPGDVYQYLDPGDLTGTRVFVDPVTSACKKFALFSGTTNSSITMPGAVCFNPPSRAPSSDPLYQQNYPVESWGKTYGFVPFSATNVSGARARANGNFVRILAKEPNTVVTYNGTTVATLDAGRFYQATLPMTEPAYITASNPVAVAQYALSQDCAGGGVSDADMVILNPVEYNIKNITVYSSTKEAITEQYVNILIKTSAAASFKVNGVVPTTRFTPLRTAPDYSYLQLNLNSYRTSSFNLSADEGFNAIAYGFGNYESYAYSAGTNLASTQFATAENPDSREEIDNACSREAFRVKVTLTAPVSSLAWQFDPSSPPETQIIPAGSSTPVVRNGTTFYDYCYPRTVSYPTAGTKTIKVVARYPAVGGCDLGEQEIDLVFDVYDPPVAKFSVPAKLCAGSAIQFTDESLDSGNKITSWLWDFGDGTTSDKQNPAHTYARAGTYPVRLTVRNSTSCTAVSLEQQITVSSAPVADFQSSVPGCDDPVIRFTDRSTNEQGAIIKWVWDFGDGSAAVENADNRMVSHRYSAGGNYTVSLTVSIANGCSTTTTQTVAINIPFLELGPDVTILRGGSYTFNTAATGTNLRYKWTPATDLDRDDVKTPVVTPTTDTRYSLTITSEEGCVLTDDIMVRVVDAPVIRNTFTPNGDGVNDEWVIDYLESYPDVKVNIFNRFGVRVYSSIGYTRPWNGIFNGSELPVGTYYYVIDPQMGLPVYTGWVTIIR